MTQALQDLVDNAVKYNLPGGWIRLDAYLEQANIHLTVANASHAMLKAIAFLIASIAVTQHEPIKLKG